MERDVDGMEMGGDDGVILGFKDDMGLYTKYDINIDIKHVVVQALMALLKQASKAA